MKKENMKKESPFEQAGGAMKQESKKTAISAADLSEMMNPRSMNFFGAAFDSTDL